MLRLTTSKTTYLEESMVAIRAGWVMTGLTIPPENFFSSKDTSRDFLDTPGPKKTHLGYFLGFSGVFSNTWQFPGVSRCISGVSKRPEFFFTLISIYVRVRKIVSLQSKIPTFPFLFVLKCY